MADRPDSGKIGQTTYRFIPSKKEYEARRSGGPPFFFHLDHASKGEREAGRAGNGLPPLFEAQLPGPSVPLPGNELNPHCRTSGKRIAIVYAHRPSDGTPTPTNQLRNIVRRMNWKFADQSSQSNGGSRVVRMAVDCNSNGEINIYNATTPNNNFVSLDEAAFYGTQGFPDLDGGKYLIFDHSQSEENPEVSGVGGTRLDAVKSSANKNTDHSVAVIYNTPWVSWESHVTIHELSHTMGAAQGAVTPKAPFSTPGFHCTDGIDILCYSDGTGGSYSETKCPEPFYYDPVNVPIDCGKDTYFNAAPAPGTWLAEYWNLAGPENPFLVAPPKATTSPATEVSGKRATLRGTVNVEGTEAYYYFEYGSTTAYGTKIPVPSAYAGLGGTAIARSELISGLNPTTTYNFRLVATNDVGTSFGSNQTFTTTAAAPPEATTEPATAIKSGHATLHGIVNPHGFQTTYYFEWGTKAEFEEGKYGHLTSKPFVGGGTSPVPVQRTIEGLKGSDEYHFRLVATSIEGTATGLDKSFTAPWGAPAVTTEAATGVTQSAATLNATVNPKEFSTTYHFQWGTTTSYGNSVPVPDESVGAGATGVKVSKSSTGLQPGTLYHFRVVATNSEGTTNGEDRTFKTLGPPAVTNEKATGVSQTGAILNASIAPNGLATTYQFQYGPTAAYGTSIPIAPESIGSGQEGVKVSQPIGALAANATYHFRVLAQNSLGSTVGPDETFTTLPACKGAEGKCEWKAQSSPDLSKSEHQLTGVSCASASMCLGVGNDQIAGAGNVELWDGSQWTNKLTFAASTSSLSGVSCTSTTWCMAVGVSKGAPKAFRLKEEGGSWGSESFVPATPSGGSNLVLRSVSCTSTTACTAVGYYYAEAEKLYKPLVERWNGTSWSVQSAPNPPAGGGLSGVNAMLSVSCSSSTSCVTVGDANSAPFAESWNGTSWSTMTIPAPSPSVESTLEGVSCTSSTACTAVGSSKESGKTNYKKPLAERWNGTSWSIQTTPSPSEAMGAVKLVGVSCTSSTACTAVGRYAPLTGENPAEQRTLVEAWNGTSWAVQSSPNSAQKVNGLAAVSCSATNACTAVGAAQPEAGQPGSGNNPNQVSLAERWNGSEWKAQATPEQSRSGYSLANVSCASASICFAVGDDLYANAGVAELWNGTTWTKQFGFGISGKDIACPATNWCMAVGAFKETTDRAWRIKLEGSTWQIEMPSMPTPSGGSKTNLRSISCTSTTACTAVGSYYVESESLYKPLVQRWNGSEWSLQTAPSPPAGNAWSAMLSVSCSSPTSCVAVGNADDATFAESWNGTSWSISSTPSPGTLESSLEGVSCASGSVCMAVGRLKDTGKGQRHKPLALRWDGTSWSTTTTPSPGGAKGDVKLRDVSCATSTHCTAVGHYWLAENESEEGTLAEYWDGAKWVVQTSPNSAQKVNALSGVSCSSAVACTAVGSSQPTPGTTINQAALVERYE